VVHKVRRDARSVVRDFDPQPASPAQPLGNVLGVARGAYPTWSALRVRPTSALAGRGNVETSGGLWLRRMLTVLQFAIAMGLTGTTLAVAWQTHYASTLNPGFDPDPLLLVATSRDMRDAQLRSFRDALARLPGVEGVGVSDTPMTVSQNSTSLRREGGQSVEINRYLVSPDSSALSAPLKRLHP
jgi:putative ABC transport system permease protein